MTKLHSNFVQINSQKKLLIAFSDESSLTDEYGTVILKNVDIGIGNNGVLSVECKEFVYINDVGFYSSSIPGYDINNTISLSGPLGLHMDVKYEDLDIANTKTTTYSRWDWFWSESKFRKPVEIKYYVGLQVKYMKNQVKISYSGWEFREYNQTYWRLKC